MIVRPAPLSQDELKGLLDSLRKEPFDDSKLEKARLLDAGLRGRMTCKQAAQVLELFSFDDRRLECGKLAVDWVTDPISIHQLVDTMKFLNTRKELMSYIQERSQPAPGPNR